MSSCYREDWSTCPIIHRCEYANIIHAMLKRTGQMKGAFKLNRDLTILTAHDSPEPSLLEHNLSYLGIRECCDVLQPAKGVTWRNTMKIELIVDYLKSGRCKSKYLLYLDAFDVVLQKGAEVIIDVFKGYECDLLFMSTNTLTGWMCMPEVKKWADSIHPGRYLNAGVFIGRPDFILEVMAEATNYVVDDPITWQEIRALGKGVIDTRLCDRLPRFPRGLPSDQLILRYLHPKYYPRMKVDYTNLLAWRQSVSSSWPDMACRLKRVQ